MPSGTPTSLSKGRKMTIKTSSIREGVESLLDHLEMHNFNQGFEACLNGIDEISNQKHNEGDTIAAEVLRWVVKELKGENVSEDN